MTYHTCSAELPKLKKEFAWLKEVDSIAVQSSVRNLADAYTRFFKKQTDAPRFKSKKNKVQSYTTKETNGNIAVVDNMIKLPKLGFVTFASKLEKEQRTMDTKTKKLKT